jgi:diacylglycerol kinase family enzyme
VAIAWRMMVGDAPRLTIDAGGRELDAIGAMAQNSNPLTFFGRRPIRICDSAKLGPPGFCLASLRTARVRDVTRLAVGALAGNVETADRHPRMEHWPQLTEARITSLEPDGMPVELDGDYLGKRQAVQLGVAPEKLLVVA